MSKKIKVPRPNEKMLKIQLNWCFLAFVHDDPDVRSPDSKLSHPVVDSSQGQYDKERAFIVLVMNEIGKERDCLDGFSKAHLIG